MKSLPFILLLLTALSACDTSMNVADPSLTTYTRFIGGDGDQTGHDIVVATDGSLILLGNTTTANGQRLYVVHTSAEGYVLWEKFIGDESVIYDEEARDLQLFTDGKIGILSMQSTSTNRDFMVRRITIDGALIDGVKYGLPGYAEEAYTLTETSDSFFVTGWTNNVTQPSPPAVNPADAMMVRFFKDLTLYPGWTTTVGGDKDFDVAIRTLEFGKSFYLFGHSNVLEPGSDAVLDYNAFVWIVGASGGVTSNRFTIGNSFIKGSLANANETVSSVSLLPAGGYIMSGYSVDPGSGNQQLFSIRIRQDLQFVPDKVTAEILAVNPVAFGSPSAVTTSTSRTSIFPSQGIGFLMLGSESLSNNENIYLKKLDNDLTEAWKTQPFVSFGGAGTDTPGAVAETADGRIILLGTMVLGESDAQGQKKMVLMKLSPNGKLGQ